MSWSGSTGGWAGVAAAALFVVPAWAGTSEDDLAVVKKAVAVTAAQAAPDVPARVASPPVPRKGEKPQWLKVKIVEKGAKKAKVSINLPLALARAIGHDLPVDWHCHGRDGQRCSLNVSDVLASLEAGQVIVEIEDEGATVRVWVE